MTYKLIIFDFDGTLADTYPWFLNVINEVADQYQFKKIEQENDDAIRGLSASQVLKHLGIPLWKVPMISKHMQSLMANDIDNINVFDGVNDMLRTFSELGIELGVVSSNNNQNISRVLGMENIAMIKHFQCGVSLFGKESKLKKIIRSSGCSLDEVIFIGDEVRDVESAKKIKINAGAVVWGYNNRDALEASSPDFVFESIDDLHQKLL
ncbi:MAG: HAD family hydrolase [Planctomycetota bacterium]|nr:MAG: HAD family hydrolase [Planctomycetota bacterium]